MSLHLGWCPRTITLHTPFLTQMLLIYHFNWLWDDILELGFWKKKSGPVVRTAAKTLIFFLTSGPISYAAGGSVSSRQNLLRALVFPALHSTSTAENQSYRITKYSSWYIVSTQSKYYFPSPSLFLVLLKRISVHGGNEVCPMPQPPYSRILQTF